MLLSVQIIPFCAILNRINYAFYNATEILKIIDVDSEMISGIIFVIYEDIIMSLFLVFNDGFYTIYAFAAVLLPQKRYTSHFLSVSILSLFFYLSVSVSLSTFSIRWIDNLNREQWKLNEECRVQTSILHLVCLVCMQCEHIGFMRYVFWCIERDVFVCRHLTLTLSPVHSLSLSIFIFSWSNHILETKRKRDKRLWFNANWNIET